MGTHGIFFRRSFCGAGEIASFNDAHMTLVLVTDFFSRKHEIFWSQFSYLLYNPVLWFTVSP